MLTDFGGWRLGIKSYTMILVTKVWALAWAYRDGGEDKTSLSEDQRKRMVVRMPSFLEYFSYVFFIGGCIMGPFIEYSDFKNWIERKENYRWLRVGELFTMSPALKRVLHGFGCMGLHLIFVVVLGFKVSFCGTEDYLTSGSLAYRIFYYFMAMTGQRFMYYTGWCISDAGCIACGISYQYLYNKERADDHNWDKVYSVKIWEIETGSAPVKMMSQWNHEIYVWLKHYVQNRVETPGKKPGLKE